MRFDYIFLIYSNKQNYNVKNNQFSYKLAKKSKNSQITFHSKMKFLLL